MKLYQIWIAGLFCAGSLFAANGVLPGAGTESSPYLIEDRADFDLFCGESNYWSSGIFTRLETDLSLSGTNFPAAVIAPDTNDDFGFQGTMFGGVFNGNGHVISNLSIVAPEMMPVSYLGLFGCVTGASCRVEGLSLKNLSITSVSEVEMVGGLCAYNGSAVIEGCHAGGQMSFGEASISIGGLCGSNEGNLMDCSAEMNLTLGAFVHDAGLLCGINSYGMIQDCSATGSITGAVYDENIGGLCGNNYGGEIARCFATGDLHFEDEVYSAGGFCGNNFENGTIRDSYAQVSIRSDGLASSCGGFCGFNDYTTIERCYAVGSVSAAAGGGFCGYNDDHRFVVDCFWDKQTSGTTSSDGGTGKTTVEMQTAGTFIDANWTEADLNTGAGDWLFVEGSYPKLVYEGASGVRVPSLIGLSCEAASNALVSAGLQVGTIDYYASWQAASNTVFESSLLAGGYVYANSPADLFVSLGGGGNGTFGSPYAVASVADLEAVNTALDAHYVVVRNIDLSAEKYTDAVVATNSPFTGTLDGNGFCISNLVIRVGMDDEYANLGLFGSVTGSLSRVCNLTLADCSINCVDWPEKVGALCGDLMDGVLSNCSVSITISVIGEGAQYVGGLCGENVSGVIVECETTGNLSVGIMSMYTGGLCGNNDGGIIRDSSSAVSINYADQMSAAGGICGGSYGTIERCFASGSISGGRDSGSIGIGGLCGENYGSIANSYATGPVSGGYMSYAVGGLCGYNSMGTVSNSYATGTVMAGGESDSIGGFCGYNDAGSIHACFWDTQTSGTTSSDGGTGKTSAEMQTQSTFTDAGWDFEDETANGTDDLWAMDGYPVLVWSVRTVSDPDVDSDGIPDWWEEQYFGGPTNASPSAVCSNGVNTVLQAYIAGLNPTRSSGFFVVSNVGNTLIWTGIEGRVYSVWWSSNLLSEFQCLDSNVTWNAGGFTDSEHAGDPEGFYKIDVRLEP